MVSALRTEALALEVAELTQQPLVCTHLITIVWSLKWIVFAFGCIKEKCRVEKTAQE